ncbi:hypothetical protein CON25_25535 [Bacillus thuringiensis]|uniref:HNH endonuclease signature motif containing protein n=1 Tax=Bacillus thuringiensis TaxID=1428 RepID=UPI000BEE4276|nr:HNH endonuclease signature motif containing protein [Bacillus thuringiensis]PEC70893.1 hypothetical protein CON25_25535 [Bacillus thuringiensis]
MYLLNLPEYKIEDFYVEMLDGRHNNDKNKFLKTRLLKIQPLLQEAQDDYKVLAEEQSLHTIQENKTLNIPSDVELDEPIPRIVNVKEMEKVYSEFLVDKPDSNKIGRKVYESILSNTYYNLCPYCSEREVKTVDHYLPKAQFASLAITPYNLLPCCSDCNKDKLDNYVLQEDQMLIHPYFDDISSESWLECKVIDNDWPITFSYSVSDTVFDATMRSRIDAHFELFKLSKLYADNAAREFNARVKLLIKEYNSNPENKALDYINDNIETYQDNKLNSWQTKMFEALKNSQWFIDEALPQLENYYRK